MWPTTLCAWTDLIYLNIRGAIPEKIDLLQKDLTKKDKDTLWRMTYIWLEMQLLCLFIRLGKCPASSFSMLKAGVWRLLCRGSHLFVCLLWHRGWTLGLCAFWRILFHWTMSSTWIFLLHKNKGRLHEEKSAKIGFLGYWWRKWKQPSVRKVIFGGCCRD